MTTKPNQRVVAAIGVFDGLHKGHQELFRRARAGALRVGGLSAAVTFDPPPYAVLSDDPDPLQITPMREKTALLTQLGLDRLLVLPFDRRFAALAPRAFVEQVLLGAFDLAGVVVGHDFRFGARREGDVPYLRALGERHGFWVDEVSPVVVDGRRVSSTLVREAIQQGRVAEATALMGRPFEVEGRVVRGHGIGGRLLVPTANLELEPQQLVPAPGVYLVRVQTPGARLPGVANVGPAPTVGTGHDRLIEVHLLDFSADLRDQSLRVAFEAWLREEKRFADLDSLREAIAQDIRAARRRLHGGEDNQLARARAM